MTCTSYKPLSNPQSRRLPPNALPKNNFREIDSWATYEHKVGQKNSYYTLLEWNRILHICIAAASRNNSSHEIVTNAETRLMRYYYLVIVMDSYGPQLVAEHRELVRALRSGNADLAHARASDHLANTVKRSMKNRLAYLQSTFREPCQHGLLQLVLQDALARPNAIASRVSQ